MNLFSAKSFCLINAVLAVIIVALSGCFKSKFDSDFHRIKYDNLRRDYLLHIPDSYSDNNKTPLIVALHGGTGSSKNIEEQSGLASFSDEKGFILCSPNGYKRTWNAGWCCGKANIGNVDDVGFIEAVIAEVESDYTIDPNRIFVTGMSNGGMMSYRLACELGDKIAAIAPVAGTMLLNDCAPSSAVSIIHFHSYEDTHVPWDGGTGDGISDHHNAPLDSVANVFTKAFDCMQDSTYTVADDVDVWQWRDCEDSTAIEYYLTNDGGHSWPMGVAPREKADAPSQTINANEVMWEFFMAHPKQ